MPQDAVIRSFVESDAAAIAALYPRAFPDEDLSGLVAALLAEPKAASLVAQADGEIVGHVAFSDCEVKGADAVVALLGPLAVAPARQRGGIGSKLVREGLARAAERGAAGAVVLGDPAYYERFGFESGHDVDAPYALPDAWAEAWRLITFRDGELSGRLTPPAAWAREALWR